MHELYVLLEGEGRMRMDDEVVTLNPLSAALVEPEHVRQLFNDREDDALWLIVGAPRQGCLHPGDNRTSS
jgi:mannose-6-phosphate isomerase-like protein (cupin superfamily)